MTTAKKQTAKKQTAKNAAMNSIVAQSGAITVQVQTRKAASAKQLKSCEPLLSAMRSTGEDTSAELLARLPTNTIAFQVFSQNATSTARLFAWFDDNRTSLTRQTKEGKTLLNISGAYLAAFNIEHDRAVDGPVKQMPFYKRFSNALQQWASRRGGVEKRASGAITDAVGAYLDKKLSDNAAALSDSLTAWVLKHEAVLQRIKKALETPAA